MFRPLTISCFLIASAFFLNAADSDGGPLATRIARSLPGSANIRVNVNMALVPVTVSDMAGRSVRGLQLGNFQVFEGSRQMPIVSFSTQDQRITVGLIFDCSGSMTDKFRTSREAPRQLFRQLNADDDSFLVTVSDKAELKEPLTSDFETLQNALLFVRPEGTTSLIDGIYLGIRELRKSHNARKALVIVSDGGDNNSRYSLREIQRVVSEADIQIFAAGLYDNPQTTEEELGPSLLAKLCDWTGGLNFMVHTVSNLEVIMGKIGVFLHNQYVLGYYPPDGPADGKYRKIKVQLTLPREMPPLVVRARSGYYAPKE